MKKIDIIGQTYGRLTVMGLHPEQKSGNRVWLCVCSCTGREIVAVAGNNLKNGHTQSCGCLSKESASSRKTHGMTNSSEYRIYRSIIARCYNERDEAYPEYGGRGITMSDEWRNSFEAFYRDMGPRPSKHHSVDRKDNDLGYTKENCRWATWEEQQNNRRNNVFYLYRGVYKTLGNWSRELSIDYHMAWRRLNKGMSFEEMVTVLTK